MKNLARITAGIGFLCLTGLLSGVIAADDAAVKPHKMTEAEIAGGIFSRPGMITTEHPGGPAHDVVSYLSEDNKFVSGMYRAGASRSEIDEPYGVDEFMYFLEGGVTLTSSDGSVMTIEAGDAVTIPREWTGIWETEGYTKIYVIYSPTGEIE